MTFWIPILILLLWVSIPELLSNPGIPGFEIPGMRTLKFTVLIIIKRLNRDPRIAYWINEAHLAVVRFFMYHQLLQGDIRSK